MKVGIGFICRMYLKILVLLSQIISTWKILIQKWGYRNENNFSGQNQSLNLCCVIASTEASWAWLYTKWRRWWRLYYVFVLTCSKGWKKKEAAFLYLPSEEEEHQSCFQTRVARHTQICYAWLHNCSFLFCLLSAKGSSKLWRNLILLVTSSVLLLELNHVNWKLKGDREHGTEWALFLSQGHSS